MSLASLRDVGAHYLRRAAKLDGAHRKRALRRARYYYTRAARVVIQQREADRRLDATRNHRVVVQRTEHAVGVGA